MFGLSSLELLGLALVGFFLVILVVWLIRSFARKK